MDPKTAATIKNHLDVGEQLLWSGRPRQGFVFRPIDFLLVPFSLLWGGFAILWEYSAIVKIPLATDGIGLLFPIIGAVFSIIGLYLIIGRFLVDRFHRAHLTYGITDHRAIIVSGAPWSSVTSNEIKTLKGVQLVECANGYGTIHLSEMASSFFGGASGMNTWHAALGHSSTFFEINEPRKAVRLLRERL